MLKLQHVIANFIAKVMINAEKSLYLQKFLTSDKKIIGFSDMKKILTCLLTVLGLTTACGQQNYENTDVQGFSELVEDTSIVVLDVRTEAEFSEGHIPGAVLIDQGHDDFVEKVKTAIPSEKKIAIYCRSGRRSANAANRLADAGYQCVNLKGGIIAWKEAGKPVTTK